MRNNSVILLLLSVLIITGIFMVANRVIEAQTDASNAGIMSKLDQVLVNQKAIIEGINSLKEELNIVKIRITQQQ